MLPVILSPQDSKHRTVGNRDRFMSCQFAIVTHQSHQDRGAEHELRVAGWLGAGFQKARADSDEALLAGAAEASKAQQAKDAASAL